MSTPAATCIYCPRPAGHFFLVEFRSRQHSYYERNLPGEGLLIWRINPIRNGNNVETSNRWT